jgi:tight adherence protein C
MDLMIVAAEAGLTLEASIERIAKEIAHTYPTLSKQLALAALEIRAGRPLDQSLRAFGERLGIDEVQGFATMIQQSKELGTSVSDALRVYSEEMRHKRMMKAEEKAYALPAKLSIPVTAFILPVVIGIAVMPTAVRMMNQ